MEDIIYTLDTQSLLRSMYPKDFGPGRADLLVLLDDESPYAYSISCGGIVNPEKRIARGIAIPITTKKITRLRELDDHRAGCSKLRYDKYPTLVKDFVKNLDSAYKRQIAYIEDALDIAVDMSRIEELREGYIPVLISGRTSTGLFLSEPTKAVIVSGNCI